MRLKKHIEQEKQTKLQIIDSVMCVYCRSIYKTKDITNHISVSHNQHNNFYPPYKRKGRINSTKFDCLICHQMFNNVSDIQYHLYNAHQVFENNSPIIPNICTQCHKTFSSKQAMINHMNICKPKDNNTTCDQCHKTFSSKQTLKNHKNICKPRNDNTTCQWCYKILCNKQSLCNHSRICKNRPI